MYNYYYNVKEDVREALVNYNYDFTADSEELREEIYNSLLMDNNVTGYEDGTYTHNAHRAERNLEGNDALLERTMELLENPIVRNPEWEDVQIRCYLLRDAIDEVIDEIREA